MRFLRVKNSFSNEGIALDSITHFTLIVRDFGGAGEDRNEIHGIRFYFKSGVVANLAVYFDCETDRKSAVTDLLKG